MVNWRAIMIMVAVVGCDPAQADAFVVPSGVGHSDVDGLRMKLVLSQLPRMGGPTAARSSSAAFRKAPGACTGWLYQEGPESDTSGLMNINFPEASSTTYWVTLVDASPGSVMTMQGRFPFARFTGLEIYTGDQLVDHLADVDIVPDPGENNPYVTGTANGTYTAFLVFGDKPQIPAPNTIYSGSLTSVALLYRIYHSTDAADPTGGALNPVLPDLSLDGVSIPSCPAHGFVQDEDSTVWGRLDNADWMGKPPGPRLRKTAYDPPVWAIADPYAAHYYPNGANFYMGALLSREFLAPATNWNLYVVRFKAPTFPDTRRGEAIHVDRQVRFWSLCTDDPYTTNVNRCVSDDKALLDKDGFATFVISDRSAKPSDATLAMFNANWIAWGALALPEDVVYDRDQNPWGIQTPVHYYSNLLYRQTEASPGFRQSFRAVSKLPKRRWKAAMGDYWPTGGYCSTADFNARGIACLTP
jgi:hypothetical protein